MGYVDCDAHVFEPDATWDYLDPNERQFGPSLVRDLDKSLEYWVIGDQRRLKNTGSEKYPSGACELEDIGARLKHMDALGIDVQILISTFWIRMNLSRPIVEAALARSYNRWMAERTADSGGRLRWLAIAPVRMMDRALEELKFASENGAVGVHVHGHIAGMVLDDEYFHPLYAKAQELDLAMCVHIGGDSRSVQIDGRADFEIITNVILGCQRLAAGRLNALFPALRWGFLEAGASWVPFLLHEAARSNEGDLNRHKDQDVNFQLFADRNLYVACQIDDDIPYLSRFVGEDNLVVGTDYSHDDIGSDIDACDIICRREDVDRQLAAKITDANGRALYHLS